VRRPDAVVPAVGIGIPTPARHEARCLSGLGPLFPSLPDLGQGDQTRAQAGQLVRRDQLGQLGVDRPDPGADRHGRGPASFGDLDLDPAAVLGFSLPLQVAPDEQGVDQLANCLLARSSQSAAAR
jgi:hypothetical protein